MKRERLSRVIKTMLFVLPLIIIGCDKDDDKEVDEQIGTKDPLSPNRIAWDYSSLQKLAPLPGNSYDYTSYPRMIELDNGDFMCVYEANGNVDMIRSADKGITWNQPVRIATNHDNIMMAVPEIIQLANNDVIVSYNPRPLSPYSSDRRFSIATKISKDNGITWGDENIVYEASYIAEYGCWEPNIIQLASSELQLYFANEADFESTYTNEQNISMFRSFDNGLTWGEREIVSFSATSRDGMPVALELDNGDIIMAIEDNYITTFKPYIIKTSNNWQNAPVGRSTSDRYAALSHNLRSAVYQGAPYIRKAPLGNVVLSYQGTNGSRENHIDFATMVVEVGDSDGTGFTNESYAFDVPLNKHALWSSLSVMDGKIWALSSTTAYGDKQDVWTIAGYEITEYIIPEKEFTIDGVVDNSANKPFFVGHKGKSNAIVDLAHNSEKLFVSVDVKDANVSDGDYIIVNIATENSDAVNPVTGTYKIKVSSNGNMDFEKGFNGNWEATDLTNKDIEVIKSETGYVAEFTINWNDLGGKPEDLRGMGFSVGILDANPVGQRPYYEDMANADKDMPYTWGCVKLK